MHGRTQRHTVTCLSRERAISDDKQSSLFTAHLFGPVPKVVHRVTHLFLQHVFLNSKLNLMKYRYKHNKHINLYIYISTSIKYNFPSSTMLAIRNSSRSAYSTTTVYSWPISLAPTRHLSSLCSPCRHLCDPGKCSRTLSACWHV